MTTIAAIETALHDCIVTSFLRDGQAVGFDSATDLLQLLDSLQLLRLVVQIESKFGVKVQDSELTPDNLGTVLRIAKLVDRKRCEVTAEPCGVLGAR